MTPSFDDIEVSFIHDDEFTSSEWTCRVTYRKDLTAEMGTGKTQLLAAIDALQKLMYIHALAYVEPDMKEYQAKCDHSSRTAPLDDLNAWTCNKCGLENKPDVKVVME